MTTRTHEPPPTRAGARRTARWLTASVALLITGASAAGIWASELYTDGVAVEAVFRGYDLISLAVVAPVLALTLLPAFVERPLAQLARVSMLAFCVYNYAYYLFGAELNAALLAHIAIFAGSLYGLVLSLMAADVAALAHRFRPGTPVQAVAVILLLLGGSLAVLQALGLAGFAFTGTVPNEPSRLVVPLSMTRLGAVLDLSLLVPAYLLAAVWLWRRRAWGYLLGTVVLLAGALHQASYVAGMAFQVAADIPGAGFDPFEPFILALFAFGSLLLLANLRRTEPQTPAASPDRTLAGTRT